MAKKYVETLLRVLPSTPTFARESATRTSNSAERGFLPALDCFSLLSDEDIASDDVKAFLSGTVDCTFHSTPKALEEQHP